MYKLNWTDRVRFGDKGKVVTESQARLCVWEFVSQLILHVKIVSLSEGSCLLAATFAANLLMLVMTSSWHRDTYINFTSSFALILSRTSLIQSFTFHLNFSACFLLFIPLTSSFHFDYLLP